MTKDEFLNSITEESAVIFRKLDEIVLKNDSLIECSIGSIMSIKTALVYNQENVFKYGIARTKNHYSFHSMVMYAHPEVLKEFKEFNAKIIFQKGCFNFKSIVDIDLKSFKDFLNRSSKIDFSPVIAHYKER